MRVSAGCQVWEESVREHDRLTIVGIVPDVRGYGTEKQNRPQLYLPYLQDGHASMDLLVRTAGDPGRFLRKSVLSLGITRGLKKTRAARL